MLRRAFKRGGPALGLVLAGLVGCGSEDAPPNTPEGEAGGGMITADASAVEAGERHYQSGLQAEARGDYRQAQEQFIQAQSYVPHYADTDARLESLREVLTAKAEYEEAKGVASAERQAQLAISYGHALRSRAPDHRDLAAARSLFEEAAAVDPENSAAHLGLGTVAAERGSIEDAVRHYQLALEADPSSAPAHYQLAFLYRSRLSEEGPDPLKALEHAKQAVETAAEPRPQYYEMLGAAHHDLGELEPAIAALEQAVTLSEAPRYSKQLEAYLHERGAGPALDEPLPGDLPPMDDEPEPTPTDELDGSGGLEPLPPVDEPADEDMGAPADEDMNAPADEQPSSAADPADPWATPDGGDDQDLPPLDDE